MNRINALLVDGYALARDSVTIMLKLTADIQTNRKLSKGVQLIGTCQGKFMTRLASLA